MHALYQVFVVFYQNEHTFLLKFLKNIRSTGEEYLEVWAEAGWSRQDPTRSMEKAQPSMGKTREMGVEPKIGGFYPPKWMVKIMVPNPIKVGWFGG